ncbi:MAG: hypothetical protein JWL59_4536 [Chthoniobacteraceae bacterium]|nr:hypothetical protein [Chthoniobacteraceae bacterium]
MKLKNNREGGTLVIALLAVLAVSAAIGVAMNTTGTTGRLTDRNRDFVEATLVAEGAVEYGFGVWKKRIQNKDGALPTIDITGPTFAGFGYSTVNGPLKVQACDAYGAPVASATAVPTGVFVSLENYPGWRGKSYNYVASARVSQTNPRGEKLEAGVRRRFQYVEVPLFQAMFFYEHDLEMYKPAPMMVTGLVHTNSDLYLSVATASTDLTFQNNVSYVKNYYDNVAPPGGSLWSPPGTMYPPQYPNGEGNQVTQVPRYEPLGKDPAAVLNTTNTNPNDDSLHEIIEPPSSAIDPATGKVFSDPGELAKRRLYNQAGIVVTINGTSATVAVKNGTTLTATQITSIAASFTGKSTMMDQREGKSVDVANFNISALTPVLNAASGFNGIIYLQDVTPATGSDAEVKSIRLQKGGILPTAGLTVVSQNPVYVQGDYNTGTTTSPTAVPANNTGNPNNTDSPTVAGYTRVPAAVIGDAVMLLSNSWSDGNAAASVGGRVASNTTFNMAILAGVMPSLYTPASGDPHYPQAQYGYSGGANNYPRFLETWSGKTCTYFGSMVELFRSKTYTGKWDTGNIYSPPTRRWNFDPKYTDNPPPGSLDAVTITRGAWMKF